MAMSKDRIQFTLPESVRFGKFRWQYEQLLDQVFGISASEAAPDGDLKIICRPSQFGRFLVLRHLDGVTNAFSCLNAAFVPNTEQKRIIDASQRRFAS